MWKKFKVSSLFDSSVRAVSLGAPFWFGLLKKIMNLRSSGGVPQVVAIPAVEKAKAPASQAAALPAEIRKNYDASSEEPVG